MCVLKIWDRHVPGNPSLLIQLLPCTSTESIGNQSLHHLHQELTAQGPLFLFATIIGRKGFPLQRGNTTWENRIYWSVNYFQELYKSKKLKCNQPQ